MITLYLKRGINFKISNIYEGILVNKELNNEFTRTADIIEKLPSSKIFTIKLDNKNTYNPTLIIKTEINNELIVFKQEISLFQLYELIKQGNGLNEDFNFNQSEFILSENKFLSVSRNQEFYLELVNKLEHEKNELRKKKPIANSKLVPFQTYFDTTGNKVFYLTSVVKGLTSTKKQLLILNCDKDTTSLSTEEIYTLLKNEEYYLLDKSNLVETGERFYFQQNQTKTGIQYLLNGFRKYLLEENLKTINNFQLVHSDLFFNDIINAYKQRYYIANIKSLDKYQLCNLVKNSYSEIEKDLFNTTFTDSELIDFSTNTVSLFLLYVHLIDEKLQEKYLWETPKRYSNHIGFRFTEPKYFSIGVTDTFSLQFNSFVNYCNTI